MRDVLAIDRVEQRRERWAQIEAQPAAVTDVENPHDFLVQSGAIPILRLGRVVGEAVSRPGFDSLGHLAACEIKGGL